MRQVGVLELKTRLSAWLDEVERTGEPVEVTRNGRPVATLAPRRRTAEEGRAAVERTLALRERYARAFPASLEPYDLRADRDDIA